MRLSAGVEPRVEIEKLIRNISLLCWLVSAFYSVVDFFNSSFVSSLILSLVSSIVFPIVLFLNKKEMRYSARVLLILGVNALIFVAVVTTPFDDGGRYFFVPASLMTLLLYERFEIKSITFGLTMALVAYLLSLKVAFPGYEGTSSTGLNLEQAKILNFFTMYAFTLAQIYVFMNYLQRLRIQAIEQSKFSALGIMSSGIAHEVNNPLAIIKGRTYTLKRHLSKGETSLVDKDIDIIIKTTDRIGKIISELGVFSRNAEKDPFDGIDSNTLVHTALDLCWERFQQAGIHIEIIDKGHFEVMDREGQLLQVLINILSNSFDAIQELDEKWVRIEVGQQMIKVIDSGRGIEKDILGKLMQPFFTTKSVGKGTGLGLSISKGIMQKHGGDLVYDATHVNTCFIVRFKNTVM